MLAFKINYKRYKNNNKIKKWIGYSKRQLYLLFPYYKSNFCNYAGIIGQSCNYRKHKLLFNVVQAGSSLFITLHSYYKQTAQVDVSYLTKIISNQDMLNFWIQVKFEAKLQKLRLWNINRQLSVVLIRSIYLKLQILVLWSLG